MFRSTYQKGFFSIFFAAGLSPLKNWSCIRGNGYTKRIFDTESGMLLLELRTLNVTLHYIALPGDLKQTLGIRLPIINLLIKNINKTFSFEIKVRDDQRIARRFRCANYLKRSSISIYETTIPLSIAGNDWLLIYFNLSEFTRRCYGTNYLETDRVQINGNIQLRRIFFSDRVVPYSELPEDYQLVHYEKKEPLNRPPKARPSSPVNDKERPQSFGKIKTGKKNERESAQAEDSKRVSLKMSAEEITETTASMVDEIPTEAQTVVEESRAEGVEVSNDVEVQIEAVAQRDATIESANDGAFESADKVPDEAANAAPIEQAVQ